MAALGLEVEAHAPPPKQKAIRPELQEWSAEITTGAGMRAGEAPSFATVSNPRMQALPPPKKSGTLKYAALAVVGAVVVLAGVKTVPRLLAGKDATSTTSQTALSETDQLLQLGIRPENAPDCFTRDQGFKFSFVDSGGQTVTVKSIADVPVLYRINARCIPE